MTLLKHIENSIEKRWTKNDEPREKQTTEKVNTVHVENIFDIYGMGFSRFFASL